MVRSRQVRRAPSRRRLPSARCDAARGATMVEYALGVALIAVVLIGATRAATNDAEDSLGDRGDSIGHPALESATTSTTSGGGGGPSSTTTSTTAGPYSGVVNGSCSGSNGWKNECTFTLSPDPSPVVPTWSLVPPTGYTGAPPAVTFTQVGSRTIRADVNGVVVQRVVSCTTNGSGKITCDVV